MHHCVHSFLFFKKRNFPCPTHQFIYLHKSIFYGLPYSMPFYLFIPLPYTTTNFPLFLKLPQCRQNLLFFVESFHTSTSLCLLLCSVVLLFYVYCLNFSFILFSISIILEIFFHTFLPFSYLFVPLSPFLINQILLSFSFIFIYSCYFPFLSPCYFTLELSPYVSFILNCPSHPRDCKLAIYWKTVSSVSSPKRCRSIVETVALE